ncbi:MAG: TerB family tellurite resistance protein, partial [Flavobacteriia bacterium]|nr:TerB family tellurite resistance protein [Flavobacteriia bacterium]
MSFVDLYSHSEHRKNLAHFAAIATLAAVDGHIN